METAILVFSSILIIGTIVKIHLNIQQSKQLHSVTVQSLQLKRTELLTLQNKLTQKIKIIDNFDKHYSKSKQKIADEILLLQYDLLNTISEN